MATPSTESGNDYANLTVSPEFRDRIREEKAKQGLSYEEYLQQYVPVEVKK